MGGAGVTAPASFMVGMETLTVMLATLMGVMAVFMVFVHREEGKRSGQAPGATGTALSLGHPTLLARMHYFVGGTLCRARGGHRLRLVESWSVRADGGSEAARRPMCSDCWRFPGD